MTGLRALSFELNKPFKHKIYGDSVENVWTTVSWENNELLQIVDKLERGTEYRTSYRINENDQLEVTTFYIALEGLQCCNDHNVCILTKI